MKYLFLLAILCCGLAHAASGPRCSPGSYSPTVNWQVGVASDQSIVSILWCDDSTGLDVWASGWNPAEEPVNACAGSVRSESPMELMAAFWTSCLSGTGSLTSAQQTTMKHLLTLWMPKMETPAQQNVWNYDANGELVGQSKGLVAEHTICQNNVVAVAGGVYYYDVSGETFVDGKTVPAHSAARCRIEVAPAKGWPQ
jgi:hypothetical protein